MTETHGFIPASPGWYVREIDEEGEFLDPVLAWKAGTTADGEDTLFPVVDGGPGYLPEVASEGSFRELTRTLVYRPSHDPGRGVAPSAAPEVTR